VTSQRSSPRRPGIGTVYDTVRENREGHGLLWPDGDGGSRMHHLAPRGDSFSVNVTSRDMGKVVMLEQRGPRPRRGPAKGH